MSSPKVRNDINKKYYSGVNTQSHSAEGKQDFRNTIHFFFYYSFHHDFSCFLSVYLQRKEKTQPKGNRNKDIDNNLNGRKKIVFHQIRSFIQR